MATLLLLRHSSFIHPVPFFALGLSTTLFVTTATLYRPQPLLCESLSSPLSNSIQTYTEDAKVPVVRNGRMNPAAYRQISGGSILGLVGGLAVRTFSKSLAFLIGLLVFGVQFAASKGFNIVPMTKLQRYLKSIDLRSAVEDNVAFKLSFGATFILAAFIEL